jgi:hypothetical protein
MTGHNGAMDTPLSGDLIRVYSTTSLPDGYLARGRLEAEGIPVIVKGEGEGPYRMGPVHLWVPSEFEVQARLILQEIQEGSMRIDEDDPPRSEEDDPLYRFEY